MKLNPTNKYCLVHSLQEELQTKEKMLHGRMSPMQLIPLELWRKLSQKFKKKNGLTLKYWLKNTSQHTDEKCRNWRRTDNNRTFPLGQPHSLHHRRHSSVRDY